MAIHERPEFYFLSELAKRIHAEGDDGLERKQILNQLKEWQHQNRMARNVADITAEIEKRQMLDDVLEMAIKFTERSFIPPWVQN
jgi:hypothetical protein